MGDHKKDKDDDVIVNMTTITKMLGVSRQRIHQLIDEGRFPKPMMEIEGKRTQRFWWLSDIRKFASDYEPQWWTRPKPD